MKMELLGTLIIQEVNKLLLYHVMVNIGQKHGEHNDYNRNTYVAGGYNGGGNACGYIDKLTSSGGKAGYQESKYSGVGGAGGGSGYIGNPSLTDKAMYCYNCEESSEESTKTVATTCTSSNPTENCAKQGNGYARVTLVKKEDILSTIQSSQHLIQMVSEFSLFSFYKLYTYNTFHITLTTQQLQFRMHKRQCFSIMYLKKSFI